MIGVSVAQPDVTLTLDNDGVIRTASVSNAIAGEGIEAWLGRPWFDTVEGSGCDSVRQMVENACKGGISAFAEVTQRFPSGLELPIEYTTVRLAGRSGLIAIGKNVQVVADLQSRLVAAQQAREQEYWKLREVETRYRLLFDSSCEAVVLVRAESLRIAELNLAAIRLLGLAPDRELLEELPPAEREPFLAMLTRVREHGRAPGIIVHLGPDRRTWTMRASLLTSEPGSAYLLQLGPVGVLPADSGPDGALVIEDLIERLPDAFVVLDADGRIRRSNRAFLELVEVGAEAAVMGEPLERWFGRSSPDLDVLLENVRRHGSARISSSTIRNERGTDVDIEISASGSTAAKPQHYGVLIRGVGMRTTPSIDGVRTSSASPALTEPVGKMSLLNVVRDAVGVIERQYIASALELTFGNRTAAAELLGLSRQSLHAKLNRYGFEGSISRPAGSED